VVLASSSFSTPAGAGMVGFFKRRAKSLPGSIDTLQVSFSLLEVLSCRFLNALGGPLSENSNLGFWMDGSSICMFSPWGHRLGGLCLCPMLVAGLVAFIVSASGCCCSALVVLVAP
jgi:hypothetical protein